MRTPTTFTTDEKPYHITTDEDTYVPYIFTTDLDPWIGVEFIANSDTYMFCGAIAMFICM